MAGLTKIIKGALGVLSKSGATVSIFNRTTSDGDIIELQKDGTTVGSIAVKNANNLHIRSTSADHVGIEFATNQILPVDASGALSNNSADIGGSSYTFKDLYLGGNIYLGGTGSANALDDYEEGTWTPVLIQSTTNPTISYTRQLGHYTKIGRLVLLTGNIYSTSVTNGSGSVRIGGLPFVINAQDQGMEGAASIGYVTGFTSTNSPQTAYCPRNNTFINLMTNSGSDARSNINVAVNNTGTNVDINFTVAYITTS